MTAEARTLTVSVERDPRAVAEYVADPRNLATWAGGLARSVRQDGARWMVDTGAGQVEVDFAPPNPFGVVDHRVSGGGVDVFVPMRVVPNGDGSEVMFTIVRDAASSDADFERDTSLVAADLQRLKQILER
jgi:Polyketide cyclase / dehydrase and lipid transport